MDVFCKTSVNFRLFLLIFAAIQLLNTRKVVVYAEDTSRVDIYGENTRFDSLLTNFSLSKSWNHNPEVKIMPSKFVDKTTEDATTVLKTH